MKFGRPTPFVGSPHKIPAFLNNGFPKRKYLFNISKRICSIYLAGGVGYLFLQVCLLGHISYLFCSNFNAQKLLLAHTTEGRAFSESCFRHFPRFFRIHEREMREVIVSIFILPQLSQWANLGYRVVELDEHQYLLFFILMCLLL